MNFFVIFATAAAPILTTTFQNFIYLLVSLCKNKPQQNKNPKASDTLVRWLGGVGWGRGAELTSEIENVMEFQAVFVVIVVCVAKIFVLMFCFVLFCLFLSETCRERSFQDSCYNYSLGKFSYIPREDITITVHRTGTPGRFSVNMSWIPPSGNFDLLYTSWLDWRWLTRRPPVTFEQYGYSILKIVYLHACL